MSAPSMVHRSGDTLVVRSVVSGDALFGETAAEQQTADDEVVDEKDLPECKIKRNYSCTACDYFTQNPRHYLYHLRDVHKEKVKIYECPNCLYASKHFQKLLRHTKMVHGSTDGVEMPEFSRSKKKPQRLDGSPSDVQIQEESEEEEEMSEGEEKTASVLKCSLCSFTARSQQALTKHGKEEHIKTKFFRCTKCTYVTHMKARFTKHVKYHSMPMIKCDLCDFRTPYKWNLDRHCKNHNGQGAFRCSACNFTADIKQSLTVHEMNHHVPPVGQAAGLGVGRRRNKVGASDAVAAEEAAQRTNEPDSTGDDTNRTNKPSSPQTPKPKQPPAKKQKTTPTQSNQEQRTSFGSDFIHPDDFIHHANGNIYIKNKCKLCNFKSAWDGGMARHEKKAHNIVRGGAPAQVKGAKKTPRPVPNLIPIPKGVKSLKQEEEDEEEVVEVMSQKDMNDICAKSANSALKDFASLFGSEDVFKDSVEDTKPTDLSSKPPPKEPDDTPLSTPKQPSSKQQQGLSFFDRLGEKLRTENSRNNLTCQYCGHESKCLTHFVCHQKVCGKEMVPTHAAVSLLVSSTRCQYCRQRCKSSTDLYNHLMTCREAAKAAKVKEEDEEEEGCDDEDTVKVKTEVTTTETYVTNVEPSETLVEAPVHVKTEEPHPMENRVFVWNNIEVPMDIEVDETAHYEYQEDAKTDDNVSSYDLSIRTQSPESESSFVSAEVVQNTVTTDKIPTHGNDISVAQHKRVFKCPHCSFWASTASRFHVHIVGHLNKKPFECSLCAYRSNWRWDITKHIKLKSVRDPAHEAAKVLMTDETGRRNYTKYNKYLTEIHMSGDQSETSGGSGTRPKHHDGGKERASPGNKAELPKLTRAPSSSDFSPLLRGSPLRPPPPLKAADAFFAKMNEKKRSTADKKTLWKCKKCNFRDPSHEKLLAHVKGHYVQAGVATTTTSGTPVQQQQQQQLDQQQHHHQLSGGEPDGDERHCRLKHGGDIRVVIGGKNGLEKLETDDQADEPDHIDQPQFGTFKCNKCPFSNDDHDEFERHLSHHSHNNDTIKCHYCPYYVSKREDLYEHLRLHGVAEPEEFAGGGAGEGKRYKCATCPYITNSKSQFLYHRQFHKPRGGQYTCLYCSYNVSKRHLLHQHLKVHGIVGSPRTNGESGGDVSEEIEEVASGLDEEEIGSSIPLVWVSKGGKFSKMFRCRYCPHVNLRKVNIQEHEKMHSSREKGRGDMEHHCSECNYVCNNAGVLSAHSKVHQGLNGKVHGLVDPTKSDEEQIRELALEEEDLEENLEENLEQTESNTMYFCGLCPARFLQEKEHSMHNRFHGLRLFYKCEYCSYTARQKPYLLAHTKVHTHSYQERSRELRTVYQVSQDHPPPTLNVLTEQNGNKIYITNEPEYKPPKLTNVPISGTELYQQRNEAQKLVQKPVDPQFGTLMHGNPDFVYPTYLKNGRMKEKRYKCHKCPSAFEKREQYKVHLSLHGSKQRYKCDHCDYSVKYFANFVQHERKHQMNAEAIAAKKSDSPEPTPTEDSSPPPLQAPSTVDDKKQIFWCPNCPYTNHRRDAVENHQKRHVSVSGLASNFTCEHCDYSVPQAHFLREHSRLHFGPSRVHQTDGFLECEGMKLVARRAGDDSSDADSVVFEDEGGRFAPPLGEDVTDRFNNNEGEKRFVDRSGDVVGVKVEEDGGGVSGGVDEN